MKYTDRIQAAKSLEESLEREWNAKPILVRLTSSVREAGTELGRLAKLMRKAGSPFSWIAQHVEKAGNLLSEATPGIIDDDEIRSATAGAVNFSADILQRYAESHLTMDRRTEEQKAIREAMFPYEYFEATPCAVGNLAEGLREKANGVVTEAAHSMKRIVDACEKAQKAKQDGSDG